MSSSTTGRQWVGLGSRAIGKDHVKEGLLCQDSLAAWPGGLVGSRSAVIAVADGHGDLEHPRSEVGSYVATRVAASVLSQFAVANKDAEFGTSLYEMFSESVPKLICRNWRNRVIAHLESCPLGCRDCERLSESSQARLAASPIRAYGTTALAALVTEKYLAMVRLGDGLIVTCEEDGTVRLPFSEQDEISQGTASLCEKNALSLMKTEMIPLRENAPHLVLLTTDGYPKSIGLIKDFLPFVNTLSEYAKEHTVAEFSDAVEKDVSNRALKARDDITFGFLLQV